MDQSTVSQELPKALKKSAQVVRRGLLTVGLATLGFGIIAWEAASNALHKR